MTAVSPKPSSPGSPIVEWDESAVNEYFLGLGLDGYRDVIYGEPETLAPSLSMILQLTRPQNMASPVMCCALSTTRRWSTWA